MHWDDILIRDAQSI